MNVPKLRFNEFGGKWEQYKFSDAVSITDCKHRTPEYISTGIPVVSPGLVRWGALDLSESSKQVSEEEAISLMDHCIVKLNDLIFSRNQSVGIASQVKTDERFVLGQDVVLLQENKLSIEYVYFYIQTTTFQNLIKRASGGSTFSRINLGELKKLNLYCGKSDEQQKIALFLSTVDKKIELLTEKKAKLTEYKKGVMQQLFNGRFEISEQSTQDGKITFIPPTLRFKADDGSDFPDWEESRLGDVNTITGGGTPSTTVEDLWGGGIQWFTPTELKKKYVSTSKRTITKKGLNSSSAKILPKGTVLFSSRATVGDVGIALHECTTNQGFQSLNAKENKTINEFTYYWLITHKNDLLRRASGSTFLEISKSEIEKISMCLPVIEEQTNIANFLSVIDQKIELANSELEKAKQWKKGLLQQMFV